MLRNLITLTVLFRVLVALISVAWLGQATPGAEPAKLTQAEVERLVYQSWKEVKYERNGLTIEVPEHLTGHRFGTKDYHSWALAGELTGVAGESEIQVIVDAKVDPMRLDIAYQYKGKNKIYVTPGIVKFEKGEMIWVEAGVEQKSETFREDGVYETRPTGFVADEKNHYVKRILMPCKYLGH